MIAQRRTFSKLLGIGILVASFAAAWLLLDLRMFLDSPLKVGEQGSVITIPPGASLTRTVHALASDGVVEHPRYLVWLARWRGVANDIQAGEYHIAPGTKPAELLEQWVNGKVIHYPLTLVEGWTFRQMMAAVDAHEMLEHTLSGLSDAEIMSAIGAPGRHPEGQFFPDTYHFPRGTPDVKIMRLAYEAMQARLLLEWGTRSADLPFSDPYEALILASIVEKETAVPAERNEIAGVLVRRLKKHMRLQVDPTVIYGLGETFNGNLGRRHLRLDTPYNTYRRHGLPPTPIAAPSGASIHAALHPAEGDSLYYVARGDGSHHFSATLQEHNEAVIRYQLNGRVRPFSSMPEGRQARPAETLAAVGS